MLPNWNKYVKVKTEIYTFLITNDKNITKSLKLELKKIK